MGRSGRQRAQGPFVSRQLQAGSSRAPQTPGQTSTAVPENRSPRSQTSRLHVGTLPGKLPGTDFWGRGGSGGQGVSVSSSPPPVPCPRPASPPCSRKRMQTASVGVTRPWLPTHCGTLGKAFPALGLSVSIYKMGG